ncbi:hypothetical protein [Aquisalimonas sp.]|uniref:hypothetical protein n=1 Tax=Aquisalimonas sp. TaxID=1872621 RepID=UPI0025B7ACF9|nr:hypothetical protein [Aquisalimonas sp.]
MGSVSAGSLTMSGGLAVYKDDILEDVIFGPTLSLRGRLDSGLYLGVEGMRLEGDQNDDGTAAANRGEVEIGIAQRATHNFDVLLGLEAVHLDRDWGPSRTDAGAAVGFRSAQNGLETEVHALYRYPEGSDESAQVGIRLRTGGVNLETGWGIGISVTWLTDERMGSALVHRRF